MGALKLIFHLPCLLCWCVSTTKSSPNSRSCITNRSQAIIVQHSSRFTTHFTLSTIITMVVKGRNIKNIDAFVKHAPVM